MRFARPLAASTVIALTIAAVGACSDNPNELTAPNKPDLAVSGAMPVVSNLKVTSGKTYKVVPNGLNNGATLYIDRTYTAQSVPSELQGAEYIETANADKIASSGSTSFIGFDVDRPVTVYVAHDDQVELPAWLKSGWTNTGKGIISTDNSKHFTLYSKGFAAGHVSVGSNVDGSYTGGGHIGSMYSVAVVSSGSSTGGSTGSVVHSGWYVAPTGASSNDGTSAHPWSLASALSNASGKIQPGDTVWLRGGTYAGAFTSTLAGTSTRPIIVRQYPGERATLDG
ncbi:MAG TPA: hypothetical protein VFS05_04050, partial [Gemmatimonadaceae bacterium]|nr:hypothetical protein [Gemmatimonadaceae bacterium]